MSISIAPERPDSPDATAMIAELEELLSAHYPQESCHGFSVEKLIAEQVAFFVLRYDGLPAACGGVKLFDAEYGELKRMYVRPQFRGLGFAKQLIEHLAGHARAHGVPLLRLETGIYQVEAIGLYEQAGFYRIPPFGPYRDDPLTLCYERPLAPR
jgi:putative acetyltransferase